MIRAPETHSTRRRPPWREWTRVLGALWLLLMTALPVQANVARLQDMIRQRPKDLRLRYLLGRKYAQAGEHQRAAQEFQAILSLKKKAVPVVQFHLGLAFARAGNLTQAVLAWTRLLEEKPNNTRTMGYLGLALYRQGLASPNEELRRRLFEDSLDWWKRILRLDPSNLRARYFAGIEYFKLGRYEDAAKQWLIFLRVRKNHPKVLGLVAKALMKLRRWDQARRTLKHLERLGEKAGNGKYVTFARKSLRKVEQAQRSGGRPPEESDLEPEDEDRDAVTQDPPGLPPPPPGPEPGPPPPLGPRPPGLPQLPVDEGMTLQAESLFLDGLDYKEQGNHEKALFAFLQAIDQQPDFSQVYLQIGEVYLALARLAPTPAEFDQRMRLAANALEKVKDLSPNTLLAHAAHSKLTVVRRSESMGFRGYHEELAKQAVAENRESDAFQEYVILLSNEDFRPTIFFQVATLVPRLSEGNLQDLRFFLEELADTRPDHPLISYLIARVYLRVYLAAAEDPERQPDEEAANLARDHMATAEKGIQDHSDEKNYLVGYADKPDAAPVDQWLTARVLARDGDGEGALERLATFLKAAGRDHPFFGLANQMKEQLTNALRPASSGTGGGDPFESERAQLFQAEKRNSEIFFKTDDEGMPLLSPGHLGDRNRFEALRLFVDNHPANGIARFLRGWLYKRKAGEATGESKDLRKQGNDDWEQVHAQHLGDPWYHHRLGKQVLRWTVIDPDLEVEAAHFFRTARFIQLAQGRMHDARLARDTLAEAAWWRERGQVPHARTMLAHTRAYDPGNLRIHLERYHLELAEGRFVGGLTVLPGWLIDGLSRYWVRQVLLSDLALLIFLAVLTTLLGFSIYLVVRYYAELHHMMLEFWEIKGMLLPLSMAVPVVLLFVFPTGLVVFVPLLCWQNMRLRERGVYVALILALMATPMMLPLTLGSNVALLRAYEQVAAGDLDGVASRLEKSMDGSSQDFTRRYLLSLVYLRQGEVASAEDVLGKLAKAADEHEGVLLNRGVAAARKGEYEQAKTFFSKALAVNPRSARALYDLAGIFRILEDEDKNQQYHRWALEIATPEVREVIEAMDEIPSDITRLPLLDQPLDPRELSPLFSFFGSYNFLALNATLLGFLTWFLLGGGLATFLVFSRERMDIQQTRCHNCLAVTRAEIGMKATDVVHCDACADPATRRQFMGNEANEKLKAEALRRARILNAFLPGMGLGFLGWTIPAALFPLGISFLFLLRISGGGFLMRTLFPVADLGPVDILLTVGVCLALALYALTQFLMWRYRDEIEAK